MYVPSTEQIARTIFLCVGPNGFSVWICAALFCPHRMPTYWLYMCRTLQKHPKNVADSSWMYREVNATCAVSWPSGSTVQCRCFFSFLSAMVTCAECAFWGLCDYPIFLFYFLFYCLLWFVWSFAILIDLYVWVKSLQAFSFCLLVFLFISPEFAFVSVCVSFWSWSSSGWQLISDGLINIDSSTW